MHRTRTPRDCLQDSLLTNQLGRLSPCVSLPASEQDAHSIHMQCMLEQDGHCLCPCLLSSAHSALLVAGIEKAMAQMLCEMPAHLLCKIDSTLPLALVLRNSESCRAFREAMHDESLWECWLRRDFPHYTRPAACSSCCYAQYTQQVCHCAD